MFNKGDILLPQNKVNSQDWLNGLFHPAVIWDQHVGDDADFRGIMLTHTERNIQYDNIPMTADHFELGHQIGFSNTHFVNQLFIKFQVWGPFKRVGKLTKDGIQFIENQLDSKSLPIEFTEYRTFAR